MAEEAALTDNMIPPDIIAPLAPTQTGLTANPQPVLHWYLSHAWQGPIHFTINRPMATDPDLEVTLYPPEESGAFLAGVHAIDLAEFELTLESGIDYEWFVFIILDPVERSADQMASATIRYDATLEARDSFREYARAGIWYDAVTDLNQRISEQPSDKELWSIRAQLMDEVDMPLVAAFDRE